MNRDAFELGCLLGGPPVEAGMGTDDLGLLAERAAADGDLVFQGGDIGDMAGGHAVVGEGPEALGRLQLRAVGRQEFQVDTRGYGHLIGNVVTGLIHHEHDLLGRARTPVASDVRECDAEERGIGPGQEQPGRLAPLGMDEGVEGGPGVTVVRRCAGALPPGSPDPAQDWLETETVFILGPQLDGCLGGGLTERPPAARQVFLNAAWAAGSAWGWRGRGTGGV